MRLVTDPEVLAGLESARRLTPITDKALLAQLEASDAPTEKPAAAPQPRLTPTPGPAPVTTPTAAPSELPPPAPSPTGRPTPAPLNVEQMGVGYIPTDVGAVQPAPIMQSAVEGGAMGLVGGGLRAAGRVAAEMAAGAYTSEKARPYIEKAIPGEGLPSAVGREVLGQGAFMAPGMAAEGVANAVRGAGLRNAARSAAEEESAFAHAKRIESPPVASEPPPPPAPAEPAGVAPGPSLAAPAGAPKPVTDPALLRELETATAPPVPPGLPESSIVKDAPPEARQPSHQVFSAPTDQLHLDAERFQYKGSADAEGVTGELAGTNQFDQFKAGPLDVWTDPADRKTYVVDGHQRYNLAKRSGTGQVNVQYLNDLGVETAQQARATAALHNIAQNPAYPGASIDAAKFFRDSGLTAADLEREGIPLNRAVAREGLGLAGLNDALFRQVQIGEMTPTRGALIGRALPDHAQQTGLQRLLAGKAEVPDKVLAQLIRDVQDAPTTEGKQVDLFGASQLKQSLALERARLTVDIRDALSKDKRLFGFLANEQRAAEAKRGGNVLQVDNNARISTAAKQALETFEQQSRLKGTISDALNHGAKRYNQGEDFNAVRNDTLTRIRQELPAFIPGLKAGGLEGVGGAAEEGPSLFGSRPAAETGPVPPVSPDILSSESGAFRLPQIIAQPVSAAREMGKIFGKIIQPTAFATDEQLNRLVGSKGENVEAQRFQYEGASRGNEAYFDRMIGKHGTPATEDYMERFSTGRNQPTPELQRLAEFHRNALDAAALGASRHKTVHYLADYLPGLFKKPEAAERWFNAAGNRPMEGSKSFFNKKEWRNVIQATRPVEEGGGGLELISPNPETLIRTYLEDVRKFTYARAWFEDAKKSGALKWVPEGKQIPEGWAEINDKIARRYFPKDQVPLVVHGQPELGSVATQTFTPAGKWVAQEGEARLVNNLHGPDSWRAVQAVRGGLAMNAALNSIQLGLSGFHLQSEAFNAWSTMLGHAGSELAQGHPLKALGRIARTPTAPLEYLIRGAKLWNDPALREAVLTELPGGQRGDLNPLRHGMRLASPTGAFSPGSSWDTAMKMWRRRSLRLEGEAHPLIKSALAPIELASKPIFSYIVPRMKVGAYYDILGNEINRHAEQLANGTVSYKTLARRAATAVDDRFGLVNYDTWFWNQNFKTAVQLLMRAPGWNFGYGREFAGGLVDLAKGNLSPRGQFLLGMIFTQVTAAALYQKFYAGKNIESLNDVIAPQDGGMDADGNPTRRVFANPLKDVASLVSEGPVNLLTSKASPISDMAVRNLITNKDYFQDYIRNTHDPLLKQAAQSFYYNLSTIKPFSIQQFQRLSESEQSPVGAFIGTRAAPRRMVEEGGPTAVLREKVAQFDREMGPRTREQVAMDERKVRARREIATGAAETPVLNSLVDQGAFGVGTQAKTNLRKFYAEAGMTPSERLMRRLPKDAREEAQHEMEAVTR